MEIENIEKFIEILFYGSGFASYDSGTNIGLILPEIHKKYFGEVFSGSGVDYKNYKK